MYDEDEFDLNSNQDKIDNSELRKSLIGLEHRFEDIRYCIFENKTTFPHSLAFLCAIPSYNSPLGLVYVSNPDRRTYQERACKDRRTLNAVFEISRRKILSRSGLSLGWEGYRLNDKPKYS